MVFPARDFHLNYLPCAPQYDLYGATHAALLSKDGGTLEWEENRGGVSKTDQSVTFLVSEGSPPVAICLALRCLPFPQPGGQEVRN